MSSKKNPKITVILPFYNSETFIKESIQSILNQTFEDFELLLINDGSTDGGALIVSNIQDKRVRLIDRKENKGLVYTLNEAFNLAESEYIARMDSDDIADANRLMAQVEFLDAHLDVALVGTGFHYIGVDFTSHPPQSHRDILYCSLFSNPFGHPTVMIRRSAIVMFDGPYRQEYYLAEDYDLWCRMLDLHETANIDEPLLAYRIHENQLSNRNETQKRVSELVRFNQFKKMVGVYFPFEQTLISRMLDSRLINPILKPLIPLWLITVFFRAVLARFLTVREILKYCRHSIWLQFKNKPIVKVETQIG